jgi:predicted NUDIX family NTP pyrophosphohydrolase
MIGISLRSVRLPATDWKPSGAPLHHRSRTIHTMTRPTSAGILLYRRTSDGGTLEVLLAHPGGPWFATKDAGHWSIPKGEADADEQLIDVARREFSEETGHPVPEASTIELGSIVQKGGKIVHAWAVEGDLDPDAAHSNLFETEWPPRSGRRATFPEIDRVAWFGPAEARVMIKPTQIPLLDRLEAALDGRA